MTEAEKAYMKFCSEIKKCIIPHKTNIEKIRLGKEADGGYVIGDIKNHTYLYSYGCNDMITFEKCFFEKYGASSYVYDHTTEKITDKPDYIHFFKEGVNGFKTHNMDTIDNHIARNGHTEDKNLCAQIDIEGYEWNIIKDCKYLENFSQIIIEFHFFGNFLHYQSNIFDTFKRLNENFVCIHLHGTNAPLQPWMDSNFPRVLEVTYIRKDLLEDYGIDYETKYPIKGLDFPTDPNRCDLPMYYWKTSHLDHISP